MQAHLPFRRVPSTAAVACAVGALLAGIGASGCGGGDPIAAERAAEEAARARSEPAKPASAESEQPAEGQPRARSALGKAKERAERLEDEVAEYQKKLEKAADGEFD